MAFNQRERIESLREGLLTRIAARAMAPGVILLSPHLIAEGLGPELPGVSAIDEGPNKMTFNTCAL